MKLNVSEVYGPVCNGEGALIGRPTIFVRLGGCDYRCRWCDSLYAVLPERRHEWTPMTPNEITERVTELLPDFGPLTGPLRLGARGHVTLSGGNPAIHPCGELVDFLHAAGIRVAIETQGSIAPNWLREIDDLTLSPKPPSSGNPTPYGPDSKLRRCLGLGRFAQRCVLKVVVFDEEDYRYATAIHAGWPDVPFYLQAGTEVGVASRDDLCAALTRWQERVLIDPDMQDVAVLPQLHALLKGHARGI